MSGLQSEAAISRRYEEAAECSDSGKRTLQASPIDDCSTRPASIISASSSLLAALAEVQSTSRVLVFRGGDEVVGQSRTGKDLPIRPERVAEVAYDQMEGTGAWRRFRHTVRFLRWRPDRDPASCTFDQLDVPLHYDLNDVLEAR